MRCGWAGVLAVAPLEVRDVLLVVALEPHHLRVALEGEDVRRDAVEEPAIVRDHHGAAGKAQQRLLQRAQRLDVQIVGGLIEQQHVAAGAQHLGEVHAVALAAGELADQLLLLRALEVEAADVAARGRLVVADLDHVEAAGDLLPDGLLVIERLARLVDVGQAHRRADADLAGIGCFGAGEHAEQRGLAGAVRADDADDAAARQVEAEVVDQQPLAVALAQALRPRSPDRRDARPAGM